MSRQANAEPTIGPTRPARSRTTSMLLPAAASPAPASKTPKTTIFRRVVVATRRKTKVTPGIVVLSASGRCSGWAMFQSNEIRRTEEPAIGLNEMLGLAEKFAAKRWTLDQHRARQSASVAET